MIKDNTLVIDAPFVADDGSIAPTLSRIFDPTTFKFGGVWQAKSGFFVHAGGNYSPGTQGRVVAAPTPTTARGASIFVSASIPA